MNILDRSYISIDAWNPLFPDQTTFLLTHLHTDHFSIPKKFKYPVYASTPTKYLTEDDPRLQCILEPNKWYRTPVHQVPFQVIKTNHTVESIGFFFPTLAVLYLGDGIDGIIPPFTPLTIVYDGLYEDVILDSPSPVQSCALITDLLQTTECNVLQLVHHGILSFLVHCGTRFRLHSSTPLLVRRAAKFMNMVDANSPYMIVGRTYEGECILHSSNWFMRDTSRNAFQSHRVGNKVRVFCSLHAMSKDVIRWKTRYPFMNFETLLTTVL
jgi:hypothetical protein